MSIYGFIGCGNMGGALANAASKKLGGGELLLANKTHAKAEKLAANIGGEAVTNAVIAKQADYIWLGVKPQMMADMLADIAPILAERTDRFVLVSMAAGLTIARIREMAGGVYPVIRIMPNTPAAIGQGMILYTSDGVTEEELAAYLDVMSAAGRFDQLPEHLIDAGSAVSGCGPAFVYPFIEALADGGVLCGLPRAKAQEYAAQTLIGAAMLVLESGQHPGALKDAVCSPGGSTIAGVRKLEEGGFRATAMNAVIAACEKTKDLGKN
ncbi:MAG: pyrroline-5-carboxylate reductase [Oscillospiraceae bacterium]|nr:pyrroline-5-carboxylate reductase [Oscillospiraceae bacterium]